MANAFDDVSRFLEQGAAAARGAVSGIAVEQFKFVCSFIRMCSDGAASGYHELNGGNASMRLTSDEVQSVRSYFYTTPGSWVALAHQVPEMANEHLLVTGTGKHLRNVAVDPDSNIGIVQLDNRGAAWRVVWGLKGGGMPTSELYAHVAAHAVRKQVTAGKARVLYHTHPADAVSFSALCPPDSREASRALWGAHTETLIAIPEGIGFVPWKVPSSEDLGRATAEALRTYRACLWQLHGVFASGDDCDAALGLVQAVDKAARIWLNLHAAAVAGEQPFALSDDDLRSLAAAYNLPINEAFLA